MNRRFLVVASLMVIVSVPAFAAGSASTNLSVTANIANNCTIATAAVAFGAYDPIATNATTPLDGAGTVSITCTKGALTTVALGLGSNAAGAVRRMTDGAASFLTYEAYQPPDNTPGTGCNYTAPTVWGTAGANLFTPAAAPNKNARTYNVCGRVAAGQDLPGGNYADTVLATVNF
jgi:spore coat protein U-like protein